MITTEQALRLGRLQERIFRCIEDELNRDPSHKSYEGALDITFSLPSIFERDKPGAWMIELHAYVLSGMDGRHEAWKGATLEEALGAAEHGVNKICRAYEMDRFSRAMDAMCDSENEIAGGKTYGPTRGEERQEMEPF